MIVLQLEVGGSVTTRQLDNLVSQTEYALAVTPIYDEGSSQPMLGEAVTGENGDFCDGIIIIFIIYLLKSLGNTLYENPHLQWCRSTDIQ